MATDLCRPRYGDSSLAEVLPSVCDGLRVPRCWDHFGLGESRRVVVIVVDGLGHQQLQAHAQIAPMLAAADRGPITTVFPSTTPTALTSLGTGLAPGEHGLLGAVFRLDGQPFAPLSWGQDPPATTIQPEPTWWERAADAGVTVRVVSPRQHRSGGLTGAAFRGGRYIGADAAGERVAEIAAALRLGTRALVYGYWEGLDKVGHVHGVHSQHYRAELAAVEHFVAAVARELPAGGRLIVTADHGMVDCDSAVDVDTNDLMAGVTLLAGEPRMRQVFTETGQAESVAERWANHLQDHAEVVLRDEAIAADWFGTVSDHHRQRIGDVLAVARGNTKLTAPTRDGRISGLRGQHGALTEAEMLVPLAVFDG